jgi:glycosyltransferase involved in cell wall biosynthesis
LRIIGEGPQRGELERLVAELSLADSVEMPGAARDVEGEYRAARVFVLPSRGEGFSNSLLEAMTFGCACIATDCPGASAETLNHGRAGVLVPVDDVAELSAALDRVTSDPALASSLGEAARVRAGDFDADKVLDRWESVLERAVWVDGPSRIDGERH